MNDYEELKRLAGEVNMPAWYETEGGSVVVLNYKAACFVEAASPASVLDIISKIEGLLAQHDRDSKELRDLCQARDEARKQRDELKAENEALRKALTYIRDTSDDWHVCEKAADALTDSRKEAGHEPV